jgi:ArsR family transcriptional regulator, virulence genes transcriptional regulator
MHEDLVERPGESDLLWELQADVCMTLANPKRLQILHMLKGGEMPAGTMARLMGIAKANLSQHLSLLRRHGLVRTRREGTRVFYRVAHPKIIEACSIMRGVLLETLGEQESLARSLRAGNTKGPDGEV